MKPESKGEKKTFKNWSNRKKEREIKIHILREAETLKMGREKRDKLRQRKQKEKGGASGRKRPESVRQRAEDRPRLTQGHLRVTGTKKRENDSKEQDRTCEFRRSQGHSE